MAKVELEHPIAYLTGMLIRSDPYYFRRYPKSGGGYMQIAQARPDRSRHVASEAGRSSRRNTDGRNIKSISTKYTITNSK